MKLLVILPLVYILLFSSFFMIEKNENDIPYKNKKLSIEDRVNDLLQRMTLEEKIEMLGGTGFETKAIKRLGIPPLNMTDGPLGVRWDEATAFPSGILMGATWNPDLISKVGSAIGEEVKAKRRHVILGPCVNIARIPMGGRNFESYGEDPFLTSRIAVDYIKGVQKENVVATVKHFAANNQEYQRGFVNTIVDERALNEIYFPAFKAAVEEGNVLALMSAYNKINGHYCSENDYLLIDKLKNEWGFNGLVMSDWGAVHSTVPTFNSGLDLEMPEGKYLNKDSLLSKLKNGELNESKLDEKIRKILRVMFTIGLFDNYQYDATKLHNTDHINLALNVAKDGIVLLKNDNSILPIDINKIKSIAIIGPNSNVAITGGGGSSMVVPIETVSPLEALNNKIGNKIKINFAQGLILDGDLDPIKTKYLLTTLDKDENGLIAEYFNNQNLEGKPVKVQVDKEINFKWNSKGPFDDFPKDNFSVRWTGYIKVDTTGRYSLDVASDDGVRLYIDDKLVIDDWSDHALMTNSYVGNFKAGKLYKIKLEYYENSGSAIVQLGWRKSNNELIANAISAARNSDIAIVFVGTNYSYESEGFDRKDLILPNGQDNLIKEITNVNKNTIVVLTTGSPVLMDEWLDKVDGLVEAWFPGEQAGNAIADILLGETNPSGKLPITFPKRWEDCSAFGSYKKEDGITRYKDGIYVGYRHFDKNNIEPLFPFGFGLSYTSFEYSDLKLSSNQMKKNEKLTASLKVKNTGKVDGKEIVQLYIRDVASSLDRPNKELKGFRKINLKAGEEGTVDFDITEDQLKYFDPQKNNWIAEPGEFEILIGSSSRDIKLKDRFILSE